MSYGLAIKTDDGLVFASDSRTHGGVDQVSLYSKLHRFEVDDERVLVLLSAGNLSVTQSVVQRLNQERGKSVTRRGLFRSETLFEAAEHVGYVSRKVQNNLLEQNKGKKFEASFILGGQVVGDAPDLFLVYPEGNAIRVPETNPFLQIGERKYGKPILDRFVRADTLLEDAARCALLSLDSTMRSNLAVGPPVDLAVYRRDDLRLAHCVRYESDSPFFMELRESWSATVLQGVRDLPRFDWE
jgi:putative proteasome-type protease